MSRNKYLIPLIFVFLILSGCARYKNVQIMQDRFVKSDSLLQSIPVAQANDIILRPDDNLYINVYGVDMGQIGIFNKQSESQTSNFNEMTLYLQGYLINKDGNIDLPVIGKVKMAGYTVRQAREELQKEIDDYIKGAVVDVRLLSYYITMMGEFNRPGTYTFMRREINVMDAIGKAGDIGVFGDRRSVLIIRKNGNQSETMELDLTNAGFYSSPYFWLQPNDIVYVKPLRSKMVSVNSTTLTLVLTSLTTLIVLLSYIQSN